MNILDINRNKLLNKIGVLAGADGAEKYKNTVVSYIYGEIPIFIKTNLNQEQWDKFLHGKLTEEELKKVV